MTTPDANSTAGILADDAGTVRSRFAPPSQGRAAAKTHRPPIGVSPAVLDAARKDGNALLRDVGTSLAGLSEAEAEERARASGPSAQEMDLNDSTAATETTPRVRTVAHGAFEADPVTWDCDPSSQSDSGSARLPLTTQAADPSLAKAGRKMRPAIVVACILLGAYAPASAQVRIGINLSLYPELVQVPGYPVYYAPQVDSNYFFYDGLYWVYAQDNWYSSSWYDGPWDMVPPEVVPLFVLRVPVRYYRQPPPYFRGWGYDAPPRWGEHWGRDWEQRRGGWDHWDRASAPAPAPLPTYQREYRGDRYPRADQQRALRSQNYHYQPREAMVRQQQYQHPTAQEGEPARRQPQAERDRRGAPPPDIRRGNRPASEGAVERQTGRPPANAAPTQEPKKNPDHDRDH